MILVRIVKNWDWPDLFRQTPGGKGTWDNIQFTCDDIEECDYLIFLNNCMKSPVRALCPPENIWVLMQEPYSPGFNRWVIEGHEPFARVYSHCSLAGGKYVKSPPAIPWFVNKSYDELAGCGPPDKSRNLSWIAGNANDLPGHKKRLALLRHIQESGSLDIDIFGRATQPIEDKWDGLASYRYSLAVENSSSPDYWTEKIADCFLSWTVPIYYGCTNIEEYFPEKSFIRIDIENPATAVGQIKKILSGDNWEDHLGALREARDLYLNKYQFFPLISRFIKPGVVHKKQKVTIPPYRRGIKAILYKMFFQN